MRFETKPSLILTENEYNTLAGAMALCQDMDVATSFDYDKDEDECVAGCQKCPKNDKCNHLSKDCVYTVARTALKGILDMSIVK